MMYILRMQLMMKQKNKKRTGLIKNATAIQSKAPHRFHWYGVALFVPFPPSPFFLHSTFFSFSPPSSYSISNLISILHHPYHNATSASTSFLIPPPFHLLLPTEPAPGNGHAQSRSPGVPGGNDWRKGVVHRVPPDPIPVLLSPSTLVRYPPTAQQAETTNDPHLPS